jgi:hypothetical protein
MYAFVILTSSFIPRQATQNDFSSWRYMIVGVYFWAGFYKINTVFVLFVFPWFVSPFLHNETLIYFLACVTPFVECAIGVCLFFQRTRVIGVLLATCMLVIVLMCLGPLGHNWGMIVWPWNVWLHILELVLFMFWRGSMVTKDILCDKRTLFAILLFWLLPCLAIVDKWGQNPSFMLYSGIPTTSFVQFDKHEDLSFLPAGAQSEIEKSNQINLMYIMLYSEHMATEPSLPGQDFIIKGARGICPHLLYPEKAKIILYTLPHVWIVKVDQKSLPLCSR